MTEPLPADATGLTPAWLTTALSARHPGVRVAAVEVLDATERTNHHLRLGLTYEVRAGAPDTLFCKLPPRDPAHRARVGAGGVGAREVHFYDEVAPSLSLRVPGCSFAAAWLAHRLHAAYTVIASFLSLVPPYNTEARRLFTSNFRARAMAAIDDLDSVGALREAGIG